MFCVGKQTQLPIQVQTVYHDLLQHFEAEPVRSVKGSIIRIERRGKSGSMGYWVARRREGAQVRETSIGPDTAGIRAQVERLREEARRHQAWSAVTRANIRILKQSGAPAPDRTTGSLLSAIARTGFFEHGGVLIGTQAFRHYPLMLGKLAPRSALAGTGDVDLLASNCVRLAGSAHRGDRDRHATRFRAR